MLACWCWQKEWRMRRKKKAADLRLQAMQASKAGENGGV